MATKGQGKRPTISDVAALAGVSRGTVSRVLNGGRWVSGDALERVERAIKESGYSANVHARSLAGGTSNSIAFVLTESEELLFADPTFETLLRLVARELAEREIAMVLMLGGTERDVNRLENFILDGHVDGVLLVSPHTSGGHLLESLARSRVPTVVCGRPLGYGGRISQVRADDRDGAQQAVSHLRERGCRRIATVAGPSDTPGGVDRLQGYRDVVGPAADDDLVVVAERYSLAAGRVAMETLLARGADFDGAFVASDLLAVGAIDALKAAGRRVPDDVPIVGFDDNRVATQVSPTLTTMRQPFQRIAAEMVRVLFAVIAGDEPVAVTLPTTLVTRESA